MYYDVEYSFPSSEAVYTILIMALDAESAKTEAKRILPDAMIHEVRVSK